MTQKLLPSRFSIVLVAGLLVFVAACEDMFAPDNGAGGANPDNGSSSGASSGSGTPDPNPDPDPTPDPEPSPDTALPEGWFMSPGDLIAGTTLTRGSTGVTDNVRVAPNMRFPIETGPAFANSQIFMPGGFGYVGGWEGPGGHENARENFEYPWRDDYCEVRNDPKIHTNALCPGGRGHQGQDIRAQTCENAVFWAVAPEDGYISYVGSISFNFRGDSGRKYRFMHVDLPPPDKDEYTALAAEGTFVRYAKGERIGLVSDLYTGGSRLTTVHIHFEIIDAAVVNGNMTGNQALPPYSSLVAAYERLVGDNPDQINPVTIPTDGSVCDLPQRP